MEQVVMDKQVWGRVTIPLIYTPKQWEGSTHRVLVGHPLLAWASSANS